MEADSDGMNERGSTFTIYSESSEQPTQNETVSPFPFYENLDLSCGATDTCLIKYNCGLASLLLTLLFAVTVKRILAKRGNISLDLKDNLLLCMTLGETTLVFVYYVFYSHPIFMFAAKMGKLFEQVVIGLIILDLTRKYRVNLLKGFIIALVACLMTTALVTLVAGIEDSFGILSEKGVSWALLSTLTLILSLSSFAIGLNLICSDPLDISAETPTIPDINNAHFAAYQQQSHFEYSDYAAAQERVLTLPKTLPQQNLASTDFLGSEQQQQMLAPSLNPPRTPQLKLPSNFDPYQGSCLNQMQNVQPENIGKPQAQVEDYKQNVVLDFHIEFKQNLKQRRCKLLSLIMVSLASVIVMIILDFHRLMYQPDDQLKTWMTVILTIIGHLTQFHAVGVLLYYIIYWPVRWNFMPEISKYEVRTMTQIENSEIDLSFLAKSRLHSFVHVKQSTQENTNSLRKIGSEHKQMSLNAKTSSPRESFQEPRTLHQSFDDGKNPPLLQRKLTSHSKSSKRQREEAVSQNKESPQSKIIQQFDISL
ncbi:hypothetical protein FGO68_gene2767 [Halteria grandinella]|uniref:Uncharacterized protein n=1 Tax=Halteria grandinella TaxID=5974 RepID=A0A8J8NVS0_HALGN|nr:hypothetical protein FGO68_gene2767 [Halteria grandinella]